MPIGPVDANAVEGMANQQILVVFSSMVAVADQGFPRRAAAIPNAESTSRVSPRV